MLLQRRNNAAQHHRALLFHRLLNLDHLKAPRQGGVFFKVLLVFGPRGGGDGAQFAARQGRFQQVGSIVLPRLAAGANHGVGLVDKQNDGHGRSLDFFNQTLEAIFKFAFDARSRLQQRQIETANHDVAQGRRNVSLGHANREAFHHCRFSHSRFAGEDGVVLPAAHQDVDNLADLHIPSQHRIDFSGLGVFGEIDGELIQIRGLSGARRVRSARVPRRQRPRAPPSLPPTAR